MHATAQHPNPGYPYLNDILCIVMMIRMTDNPWLRFTDSLGSKYEDSTHRDYKDRVL